MTAMRGARLVLATMLLPAAVAAQRPAVPPPPPAPAATVRVTLATDQGPIVLALEQDRAPVTTANFLRYVDQKRFDGVTLYRAVRVAPGYGLVQGGVRNAPKRVLPAIAHEPTSRTGLSHTDGAVSMARNAPGSASGDFFVTVGDIPSMDAHPDQAGDNLGFAAFGHVVGGMDIVRRTLDAPTSPTDGAPGMTGEMLLAPVRILTARRTP